MTQGTKSDGKPAAAVPPPPKEVRILDGGAIPRASTFSFGITLDQLNESFASILKTSIFYPVAYHFVRELGRGRQGRVFLALRQGARGCITEHAIKLYDPSIYRNPEEYWTDMGRIAAQISSLHHLQSPNLVSRYSYEETYGIGYVQLEVIGGFDLRRMGSVKQYESARKRAGATELEWKKETGNIYRMYGGNLCLQPGIVVYILRGVLKGLEHLHGAGFLHCDIKPGDIMIDRLGTVKVVDFGRAVIIGEKLAFLLGSPMYMSPEMHRREKCGIQTDFYSLGLVALEMLRGKPLADPANTTEEELLEIKMSLAKDLSYLLPSDVLANRHLVSIIAKFLDPDPRKRFASAKDADVGEAGLRIVDKQLVQAGLDSEYARDLAGYLSKQVNKYTQRMEIELEE